jgi:tetratricopeptide (TPR) repeat protein
MNVGLDVDHYGLNKFKSRSDDKYILVRNSILSAIEPIISQKQQQYSVPIDTVEYYTERQDLSAAIAEKLRVHHPLASVPYALVMYGLGGSGKTQLALKYIEDHKNEYSTVLWIDATDEESARASFQRCANDLQLQIDSKQAQSSSLADSPLVQAVLQSLRNRKDIDKKWLVVVDNADDVTWGIKKIIPRGRQGSIIITSQDGESRKLVGGGCEELRVGMMEAEEARALILRHLALDLDTVPDEILEECDKIAERLGYLALAVDLAGAYISNDDTDKIESLRQYLADYTRHQDDLLQSEYYCGLSADSKTVWTVWDTTLGKIEASYANVRPGLVLAFLAHFKGLVIQDELLRLASLGMLRIGEKLYDGAVKLPGWLDKALMVKNGEWDDYYYRESRRVLVRYSLLQRVEGEWPGVSMHGLVQWRARKYEEEQKWKHWNLMAVLAGCTQLSEEEARPQFRRELAAHVPAVENAYLDKLEVKNVGKEFVWRTVSEVLYDEARWEEAEELLVQAMEVSKKMLGLDHPNTVVYVAILASMYRNQGRWNVAEELFVQVIETSKEKLGVDHPITLTYMANLASTYLKQGRWDSAEELEVQVIETRKKKLGVDHPDTLSSMVNLASTYSYQGRWSVAEELFVQVIEASKEKLGVDHPNTLTCMANLASTYGDQGRWDVAEELFMQVIETRKKKLGVDHPDTLWSMANLASTYSYQGRWNVAEELFVQVIEASKKKLGVDHPDTLSSMANLALTYNRQGRWDSAKELFMQVIETRKKRLGVDHPDTLSSMVNLASTYSYQGRWSVAEELFVQVIEASKEKLGVDHPNTLTCMANLASTYGAQGRWDVAEELLVQVMETRKKKLGVGHPDTLASMANLAFTWKAQGRTVEAIFLLRECTQRCQRVLQPSHPMSRSFSDTLGRWEADQ